MAFAKLISTDYLFKYTIIDDNVDPDLLGKFIIQAQDLNIQQVIGNTLYVKIMNDVVNNTISGYYKTLLDDYIQRCQAEWTVYHVFPFINYRLTNKAVSEKNSDNSNPTTLDNIQWLREQVRNTAEFYSTRIREYIVNNQVQFPEYFNPSQNLLSIKPKWNNYFGGIYTGPNGCGDCKCGRGVRCNCCNKINIYGC
jgi:hypothetical protein